MKKLELLDEIFYFCITCSYDWLKICLENGADLNIKNKNNDTPFRFLCENKSLTKEMLEFALQNGADINNESTYNKTAFDIICDYNSHLIPVCKNYIDELKFVKKCKEYNIDYKEYIN